MSSQSWSEQEVYVLREYAGAGLGAEDVARAVGRSTEAVCRKARRLGIPLAEKAKPVEQSQTITVHKDEVIGLTSLDELVKFFSVDLSKWDVRNFRVNNWNDSCQVRADFIPKQSDAAEQIKLAADLLIQDAITHAPAYELPTYPSFSGGDPAMFELAIMDPHVGMLAWGKEVGGTSYDSNIAVQDYEKVVDTLLPFASFYPVEKIVYLVGNDTLHVDTTAAGTGKGGTTAMGTMQDVDTRLAKAFTAVRRAVIAGVDKARNIAPVDIVVVPGNHDPQQMYRLGEVLMAWYRNDPAVNVIYGPNKRKFYGYGANAFMYTHGEEYKRQRDSLPLIFATECPPQLWADSLYREIHTGHNHAAMAGAYHPTSELSESRAIRVRSLPALTPVDSWHHESGYKSHRAATALVYRRSGGLVGYHESCLI